MCVQYSILQLPCLKNLNQILKEIRSMNLRQGLRTKRQR